jgi:hypothetical protein
MQTLGYDDTETAACGTADGTSAAEAVPDNPNRLAVNTAAAPAPTSIRRTVRVIEDIVHPFLIQEADENARQPEPERSILHVWAADALQFCHFRVCLE